MGLDGEVLLKQLFKINVKKFYTAYSFQGSDRRAQEIGRGRTSHDHWLTDGQDHGKNALETLSKGSPWAATYPHTIVNNTRIRGDPHPTQENNKQHFISRLSWVVHSTTETLPGLERSAKCKHVSKTLFSNLMFIYPALGSHRQDHGDVNTNTSYSQVLSTENRELCIQPPGLVESRSSHSHSKHMSQYGHGTFTVLI